MGILVYRDSPTGDRFVGRIDYAREVEARFAYDQSYLAAAWAAGEIGLSETLPLDDMPFNAGEISAFFRGLLPEGEVMTGLVELYQIPRNDYLTLIEQLGCESIGALRFVSESVDPNEYQASYEALNAGETIASLGNPVRMAVQTASSTRLSLAGAQSKVAWFLPEDKDASAVELDEWYVPKGTAPSSHIIKVSRRGEEAIAANETACSVLCAACGIDTVKVSLVSGLPGALAIRRYDREWIDSAGGRKLLRRHQEDFCQALGMSTLFKYQPMGTDEDYLRRIADLLERASDNPGADKVEFAKRLVFDYAVGNSDAHLKNSSLLYNAKWTGRRLAPKYDVTCIPLTGYSTLMPYDIGKHRKLDEIDANDVMSIALDLDVSLGDFDVVVRQVVDGLESATSSGHEPEVDEMIGRIVDNSAPRLAVLKSFLGE